MKCGIYKITNKINHKCYIGQSVNIYRRWQKERTGAFNPNGCEYNCSRSRAFRKYGIDNFTFEIIEECQPSQLNEREIYWANFYNSYSPNGYNDALCGDQFSHPMKLQSIEIVQQIIDDLHKPFLSGIELGKKYGVSDQTISDINNGKIWKKEGEKYPIRPRIRKQKYCCICGVPIDYKATYCKACASIKSRVVDRPPKEQLLKEIATSSFRAVAKKYGVSDKAIVKWCVEYQLPKHKKELVDLYKSQYSNQ